MLILEFTAYKTALVALHRLIFMGQNVDDVGSFNRYKRYELRDISKTAPVGWTNITALVQKFELSKSLSDQCCCSKLLTVVVWQSGNEMMFIMSDFNGVRGAYSYNGQPSGTVKLVN